MLEEKILSVLEKMQADISGLKAGQDAMQVDISGIKGSSCTEIERKINFLRGAGTYAGKAGTPG